MNIKNTLGNPAAMRRFFTGSAFFFSSLALYFLFVVGNILLVGYCGWGLFISLVGVGINLIREKNQ